MNKTSKINVHLTKLLSPVIAGLLKQFWKAAAFPGHYTERRLQDRVLW